MKKSARCPITNFNRKACPCCIMLDMIKLVVREVK